MLVNIRQTVLNTFWFLPVISFSPLSEQIVSLGFAFLPTAAKRAFIAFRPESAYIRGIFSAKSCKRNVRLQPHVVITEYEMTYTQIELHKVSIFCQTHFPPNI